jgi:NifU-like protein involved in Fe-S cluster formation
VPSHVADHLQDPRHAAPLLGADLVGQASEEGRTVQLGLWLEGGKVTVARFRASSCASLIAYAEVACTLLEAGLSPKALDAGVLERELSGVHPSHRRRAEIVARAARAATPRMNTP